MTATADEPTVEQTVVRARPGSVDASVVFALALVVRLGLVVLSPGGFAGDYGYDASVYYTASASLVHGRLPYADFLLLHPPGLMLVLTPVALLGRLTTDHAAFITGNLIFTVVGAVNALLVHRIALHWGLGRRAALVGGVFYALWLSAAGPEISARLEPLGTFAFLLGTLLLARARPSGRALVAAGAALGFAVTVKIWWIVPVLVLVGWQLAVRRDRGVAVRLVGGAVGALAVVLGPFFVAAPGAMWRMLVSDQLGRNTVSGSRLFRVFDLSSLRQLGDGRGIEVVAVLVTVVVAALLGRAAWRQRAARPLVVVAVAQVAVLLLSPSYFNYYSGYLAAAVALTVAAAASGRRPLLAPLTTVVAAGVTVVALVGTPVVFVPRPLPVGQLPAAVARVRCVMADSPMALIGLDTVSPGLARGCPNWVDVSGRTYDVDAPVGRYVPRFDNLRWQRSVMTYLQSGDAVILIRKGTGLSRASLRTIHRLPVLARSGRLVVYRTR